MRWARVRVCEKTGQGYRDCVGGMGYGKCGILFKKEIQNRLLEGHF